jgi:hydroxymethylpyrimidine pyrophosphatase-like HAD family hydrolase
MSRRFDAILCDIDGCLGPETTAPMDAQAFALLAAHNHRAQRAHDVPVITLCTGRPQPYAEAICRLLGNTSLPIVCEMGVWLYDPRDNAYLFDPTISEHDFEAVAACTRWVRSTLVPEGAVIQPGKTATLSLWHEDTERLMAMKPRIQAALAEHGWPLRLSSSVAWLNLELMHVSKGTGIRRLMAHAGLRRERLAGIGDTLGDLAIREHVAFFACPNNADARLKAVADYVASADEVHGVIEILARCS